MGPIAFTHTYIGKKKIPTFTRFINALGPKSDNQPIENAFFRKLLVIRLFS
jgi:hypothetical protein